MSQEHVVSISLALTCIGTILEMNIFIWELFTPF